MIDFVPDVPRWLQVHAEILRRIKAGDYAPRTRVPSVVQLQEEFGIAGATAQKVHRQLRADGMIYTVPGMGSFVSPQ
ncbi:GntR family transcriptional regulator [Streptomyces sp. NPDC090306]|uniref:GntR family transcriptional regulator n=1 Tax=Streptomyces sp. NPDC090306 TaxID=3365961 RepID=UPI00381A2569